jgi:hypothetical protein
MPWSDWALPPGPATRAAASASINPELAADPIPPPPPPPPQGMDDLLALLRSKARPLAVGGQLVSGRALGQLAGAYVDALNQGAVPQMLTAWQVAKSGAAGWWCSTVGGMCRGTAGAGGRVGWGAEWRGPQPELPCMAGIPLPCASPAACLLPPSSPSPLSPTHPSHLPDSPRASRAPSARRPTTPRRRRSRRLLCPLWRARAATMTRCWRSSGWVGRPAAGGGGGQGSADGPWRAGRGLPTPPTGGARR